MDGLVLLPSLLQLVMLLVTDCSGTARSRGRRHRHQTVGVDGLRWSGDDCCSDVIHCRCWRPDVRSFCLGGVAVNRCIRLNALVLHDRHIRGTIVVDQPRHSLRCGPLEACFSCAWAIVRCRELQIDEIKVFAIRIRMSSRGTGLATSERPFI